jgi:hypothetical protein
MSYDMKLLVSTCLVSCILSLPAHAQVAQPKEIPPGLTVIDGDILMPTAFVDSVLHGSGFIEGTPQATFKSPANGWVSGLPPFQVRGTVPYEFDGNVTPANQTAMINAMAVLESVANVHFEQCSSNICIFSQTNFVHIANGTMNDSQVGMVGGEQFINISSWGTQFTIVHELLHCLGFYHEQERPDRDNFIQVNCANVQGGCSGTLFNNNFALLSAITLGTYDFDSVMHYDQCAFSIDCPAGSTCACTNKTMIVLAPNQGQQNLIGQRNHLSSLDRAAVSFLYPFDGWQFLDCAYNGANGSSDGSFSRPYTTLAAALANTAPGGTIWVLTNCTFPSGTYNKQVTVKVAPGITARIGS